MNGKHLSGRQIREARRSRGWFQADLAEAIVNLAKRDREARGLTDPSGHRTLDPSIISHWESGRHPVPYHWQPYVAEALGLSRTLLFGSVAA